VFNILIIALYLLIYFIRPGDWGEGLAFPLQQSIGIVALIVIAYTIIVDSGDGKDKDNSNLYIFGFIFIAMLSSVANGWAGGAYVFLLKFIPAIVGYCLMIYVCKAQKQWDFIVGLLIFIMMFISWQMYVQISTGTAIGGLQPFMRIINEDTINETKVPQAVWYGVFNDPNDLGMALLMFLPYLLNKILEKKWLYIFPVALILNGIYLTNSRGTIIALIVGLGSYFFLRKRSYKGILIAIFFAVLVLVFGPSRVAEMGTSDDSSAGRFDAWYEAFQLFIRQPFFGIGVGNFTDYHEITAHNSFVLVMAETGFFGLLCFIAIFSIPAYSAIRIIFSKDLNQELLNLIAIFSGVISVIFSIMLISRPYVMMPYLCLAVLTTYMNINYREAFLAFSSHITFGRLCLVSISFVIGLFFMLKILL
jgi:putative inorganic carbon (HCO3(-)) transporter